MSLRSQTELTSDPFHQRREGTTQGVQWRTAQWNNGCGWGVWPGCHPIYPGLCTGWHNLHHPGLPHPFIYFSCLFLGPQAWAHFYLFSQDSWPDRPEGGPVGRQEQAGCTHSLAGAHVKRQTYNMQILSSWYTNRDIHVYTTKCRELWGHMGHTFRYIITCV